MYWKCLKVQKNTVHIPKLIFKKGQNMKAVVISQPGKVVLKDIPYPKPGQDEITIKVKNCGVCGTDYHIYNGDFVGSYPIVPGHEISGTVYELGSGVSEPEIGTRVAVDPTIFCGNCYFCKTNRGNHCLNWQALGVTRNGGFSEYIVVPQKNVYPISEKISLIEAAFIEPVSCIVSSLNKLKIKTGDNVLIFGAGPIGLQIGQLVRHGNAASVTISDLEPARLELARKLGFTKTVPVDNSQKGILSNIAPLGFDIVIDATGISKVAESTFLYVKNTGKIMFFGVCPQSENISVNPFNIYRRDLEIYGSFSLCYTFYPAIDFFENKVLSVEPLTSDLIPLEVLLKTLELKHPKKGKMKIVVNL